MTLPRFQPWWCDNSPSFPGCTGYRIVDTKHRFEAGFISCMPGTDRRARKDQETARRIADARCDKLNRETA